MALKLLFCYSFTKHQKQQNNKTFLQKVPDSKKIVHEFGEILWELSEGPEELFTCEKFGAEKQKENRKFGKKFEGKLDGVFLHLIKKNTKFSF